MESHIFPLSLNIMGVVIKYKAVTVNPLTELSCCLQQCFIIVH